MTDCVFCDFSKIVSRTITTIRGFHVTISLGQITSGGYLLLIPAQHTPCLGDLDAKRLAVLDSVLDCVAGTLESEYDELVTFFEHGIVGQTVNHAHLHLFPAQVDLESVVAADFPDCQIQTFQGFSEFGQLYQKKKVPYLLWSTPNNEIRVCWNPPAKPEYLRLVTANQLKVPERGNWKNMDTKLDERLIHETMFTLLPIFTP